MIYTQTATSASYFFMYALYFMILHKYYKEEDAALAAERLHMSSQVIK